jgi:hypothetical protein
METNTYLFFGYPKQEKYQITISIPEGYVVASVPAPIKIATVQNVGLFVFNVLQRERNTNFLYRRNKQLVSSDFYEVLKDFFHQMNKQNEKIVLTKV